jgi:hypothetical protein
MQRPRRFGRLRALLLLSTFALAGCPDSNFIGVQDFGTVNGRVVDARSNQPVNGAVVSVGSLEVVRVGNDGIFSLPHVPVGTQTVTVRAVGYATVTANVIVLKGQTADAGLVSLPTVGNAGGALPSGGPAGVGPTASPAPSPSGAPSGSPAPAASPPLASPAPSASLQAGPSPAASPSPGR